MQINWSLEKVLRQQLGKKQTLAMLLVTMRTSMRCSMNQSLRLGLEQRLELPLVQVLLLWFLLILSPRDDQRPNMMSLLQRLRLLGKGPGLNLPKQQFLIK